MAKNEKNWKNTHEGRSLEATIGAFGVSTSLLKTEADLVSCAEKLFQIETKKRTVSEAFAAVKCLSKKERSKRAKANVRSVISALRGGSAEQAKPKSVRSYFSKKRNEPLNPKSVDELIAWRETLVAKLERAQEQRLPWASCYAAEIAMIDRAVLSGLL